MYSMSMRTSQELCLATYSDKYHIDKPAGLWVPDSLFLPTQVHNVCLLRVHIEKISQTMH